MDYEVAEVQGLKPRGKSKKTWTEVVDRLSGLSTKQGGCNRP